jgi:hypothetical protein
LIASLVNKTPWKFNLHKQDDPDLNRYPGVNCDLPSGMTLDIDYGSEYDEAPLKMEVQFSLGSAQMFEHMQSTLIVITIERKAKAKSASDVLWLVEARPHDPHKVGHPGFTDFIRIVKGSLTNAKLSMYSASTKSNPSFRTRPFRLLYGDGGL